MGNLLFHSGQYKGKRVGIPEGKVITLGRNRDLELPLPDGKLSRRHCQISFKEDHYVLTDLGSTNGTYLNGERITGEVVLSTFDRIVVGDTEMEFQAMEKVPLPLDFKGAVPDPFGLDLGENEAPPEALQELNIPLEEIQAQDAPDDTGLAVAAAPGGSAPVVESSAHAAPPAAAPTVPVFPQVPAPAEAQKLPEAKAKVQVEVVGAAVAPPGDLLEAALRDLDMPLPPEPPPLEPAGQEEAPKPKLLFCTVCEGSVTLLDYELGVARSVDGRVVCKECLALAPKSVPPAQAASQGKPARPKLVFCTVCEGSIPARDFDQGLVRVVDGQVVCKECLAKAPKPALSQADSKSVAAVRSRTGEQSVDDVLKALDEEAVIIDTAQKRGGTPPAGTSKSVTKTPPPGITEELGDEFEEIH
ncbi:MAG: FHA domain-containing protein [Planctomycetota bacterium]